VLYINDTRRGHIRAFDLLPSGALARHTDRVFADLSGPEPGVPDGMKVDVEGNVYCGGSGGLWVIDPNGKKLGRIVHGAPATTNLAFGGSDWKTLYFTSRNHLGAVAVKIPGIPVPAGKK
jgi:gluconolactonase